MRAVELPHHALLERLVPVLDEVLDLVERADTERVARAEELPPCQRLARAILLDRRKASDELWITLQVGEGVPDSGGRRLYHLVQDSVWLTASKGVARGWDFLRG